LHAPVNGQWRPEYTARYKDHLDPNHKVYVEYSNEGWQFQLIKDALTAYSGEVQGVFCWYTFIGGCWGLKVMTGDAAGISPKWSGWLDWIGANPLGVLPGQPEGPDGRTSVSAGQRPLLPLRSALVFKFRLTPDTMPHAGHGRAPFFGNGRPAPLAARTAFALRKPASRLLHRVFHRGVYLTLHRPVLKPSRRHGRPLFPA